MKHYAKAVMTIAGIAIIAFSAWADQLTINTVTASSEQAGNGITNVLDNSTATRWAASDATFPQWVLVDLGQVKNVDSTVTAFYLPTGRTYTYDIQASLDDITYFQAVASKQSSATGPTKDSLGVKARYLKINYTAVSNGTGWAGMYDVSVFGSATKYGAWSQSTDLILNTKATGANVANSLTNFPVLVRLTANNSAIFTAAKANGADIRFAKANDVSLPYQIEQWNATTKQAAIWVLVDTIKGNDSSASIKMYYGNTAAIDSSTPNSVFDTAKGFQAVYHLGETGDTARDATINKYSASPVTAPLDTAGLIGRARYFDGSASAYDIVGSSDSSGIFNKLHFPDNGIYTLSAWVNPTSITALSAIIARGSGGASEYHLYARAASTEFRFLENRSTADGGQQYVGSGTGTAVTGTWTHVVGVRNGINMSIFVNGAVIASPTTGAVGGTRTIEYDVNIGRRSDASNYFNGFIDEVQIANVARDSSWIKLSYENQKASQTLVFVKGTVIGIATQPSISNTAMLENGTTVQLKVAGKAPVACHMATAHMTGVKMSIVDLYGRTVWNNTFSGNVREVSWNGETLSGNHAVAGTYIVRLTALGSTAATADQKVILLP